MERFWRHFSERKHRIESLEVSLSRRLWRLKDDRTTLWTPEALKLLKIDDLVKLIKKL